MNKTISIDLTEEQLQKIREAGLLPSDKKGQWMPDPDERYYHVDYYGDVDSYYFSGDRPDTFRRDSGNMFKTIEEAAAHLAKIQALNCINRYCWDNWYFEPNWGDSSQDKYEIYYDNWANEFARRAWSYRQPTVVIPLLPSLEAANDVMSHCKDDLLTVFGVK